MSICQNRGKRKLAELGALTIDLRFLIVQGVIYLSCFGNRALSTDYHKMPLNEYSLVAFVVDSLMPIQSLQHHSYVWVSNNLYEDDSMRLDKFICKSTELSKTEAIQRICAGLVMVNGEIIIDESTQVHENNTIIMNGEKLAARPFRYLLMHKPANTICSNVDGDYPSLFNHLSTQTAADKKSFIENMDELHIAGRLDVDTTGLVLITDDGRWTYNITRPDKHCSKVYRVGLSYGIPAEKAEEVVAQFKDGLQLQGEKQLTLPATLVVISPKEVLLTITEGKYHQVKRMFAAIGNRVLTLHREQIGNIQLDIQEGQWRYLAADEINLFMR